MGSDPSIILADDKKEDNNLHKKFISLSTSY